MLWEDMVIRVKLYDQKGVYLEAELFKWEIPKGLFLIMKFAN